jgi:hypothetical protein
MHAARVLHGAQAPEIRGAYRSLHARITRCTGMHSAVLLVMASSTSSAVSSLRCGQSARRTTSATSSLHAYATHAEGMLHMPVCMQETAAASSSCEKVPAA